MVLGWACGPGIDTGHSCFWRERTEGDTTGFCAQAGKGSVWRCLAGYIRMGAEEDPLHVGAVQVWLGSRECSLEPKPELCMGCRMSWTWDT